MSTNKIEYKTEVITIRLIQSNIVENSISSHATLDVKDVWETKRINSELTKGQPYAYLATQGEFSAITKEAKILLASKKIVGNTVAKALLVQSLSDRIIANFYLTINRPIVTTKIFNDRSKAITWLRQQLENHQKP